MSENELALSRLEEERDALRREKRGVEEMLFLVLKQVAEPVFVSDEEIKAGIQSDHIIDINWDVQRDGWEFSIKKVDEDIEQ